MPLDAIKNLSPSVIIGTRTRKGSTRTENRLNLLRGQAVCSIYFYRRAGGARVGPNLRYYASCTKNATKLCAICLIDFFLKV